MMQDTINEIYNIVKLSEKGVTVKDIKSQTKFCDTTILRILRLLRTQNKINHIHIKPSNLMGKKATLWYVKGGVDNNGQRCL